MFLWLQDWIDETRRIKRAVDAAMVGWQRERQAAAHRMRKQLRYTRLHLEGLEDRVLMNNDLLIWKPPVGGGNKASIAANWFDVDLNKQGVTAPTYSNQVWLDAAWSNAPIIWDVNTYPQGNPTSFPVSLISLKYGYKAQQTIDAGVALQSALGMGVDSTSTVNIKFNSSNSSFWQTGGNNEWLNFNLTSGAGTTVFNAVNISGGSLTIGTNSGLTETSQVGINVNPAGTLIFGTPQAGTLSTLTLQNGTGYPSADGGTVYLYGATTAGTSATFVNGDGGGNLATGSEELTAETSGSSTGVIYYVGTGVTSGNLIRDNLNVPVWADGGIFSANGGGTYGFYTPTGSSGSILAVSGFTQDTQKYSVYASGDANGNAGTVQLSGDILLQVNNDLDIVNNAFLQTGDNTGIIITDPGQLIVGAGGTINIWYGTGPGGVYQFGALTINGNLSMSGTYDAAVGVDSNDNAVSVILYVTGTETWYTGTSFIQPFEVGTENTGFWTINTAGSISIQTGEIKHSSGWYYTAGNTALTVWN